MLFARRLLVSTAVAAAMLASLTSCGGTAEPDYGEAITALKDAGAQISYSDEEAKAPNRRKAVTGVIFSVGTEDAAAAAFESLPQLRRLPHPEDVELIFSSLDTTYINKLLQHVPRHADVLSKLKGFLINIDPDSPVSDADICALSQIPTLSQLGVSPLKRVDVTDKGLACIKKLQGLHTLALNNTRITDEGLSHLGGMKHLEHLLLGDTEITGEGFRVFKDLPLRRLILVGSKVTDENLKWLSDLQQLEQLALDGCPIDGSGLKYLSGMKALRRLSLSETQIDDNALLHLQQLPTLEELFLYKCAITDACIPGLAKLKRLKRLVVGATKLSHAGYQTLNEALSDTRIE